MIGSSFRRLARRLLPAPVGVRIRNWRLARFAKQSAGLTSKEIFTRIYTKGMWGTSTDPGRPFYSGSGSADGEVVQAYVAHVSAFLKSLPTKPNVVDLGCGDFHVGRQLRGFCADYTACDIVEPLIEFNRKRFGDLNVEFKVLDMARDPIPAGDVIFVRQAFQHMSNAEIMAALLKIRNSSQYLIVTESLPSEPGFLPNRDKTAGNEIRMKFHSGVVLTEPPFSLQYEDRRELCSIPELATLVQTTVYRLR